MSYSTDLSFDLLQQKIIVNTGKNTRATTKSMKNTINNLMYTASSVDSAGRAINDKHN